MHVCVSVRDATLKLKEPQDHWWTQRRLTLKRFYMFTFAGFPIKYVISFNIHFLLVFVRTPTIWTELK